MIDERELREEICQIGSKLYQKNYVIAMDGNLSVRLPGNLLLCTPSGACKGELSPHEIIKTNMEGEKIFGPGRVSSEVKMHLLIYKNRPDVRAIVHAHPVTAVSLTVAGKTLDDILVPEVIAHLGRIATASYSTPGTQDLADSLLPYLSDHNAIVLARHGAVTMAETLKQAFYRMECLEYAAKVALLAGQLGPLDPLPTAEVEKLHSLCKK